jgi:hypothetical protein
MAPLGAVGMTIRGSPLSGAVQSRHNLVSGNLNHDAVMRIGSEAPKRRTHSSNRHESQGACRESATSNHHRPPSQAHGQGQNCRGFLQRPPFMVPDAKRRRPVQRPPAQAATGRSEACAPRPRSWFCECRGRSRCGPETTTLIESCLVEPGRPNGQVLSPSTPPGTSSRSRRVSQRGRHWRA